MLTKEASPRNGESHQPTSLRNVNPQPQLRPHQSSRKSRLRTVRNHTPSVHRIGAVRRRWAKSNVPLPFVDHWNVASIPVRRCPVPGSPARAAAGQIQSRQRGRGARDRLHSKAANAGGAESRHRHTTTGFMRPQNALRQSAATRLSFTG
jgi:hypothetical protein